MELRVLKYFLTVADEGNITRAADILHVTQPTLSRQLIELEDELGTALMIVEMFTPGFGVAGVLGILCFVLAIVFRADSLAAALWMIILVAMLVGVLLLIFLRSATKGKISRSAIVLQEQLKSEEGYLSSDDLQFFVGKDGVALTVLRPSGMADFDGVKLDVVSDGEYLECGQKVRVVRVEGRRMVVQAIKPDGELKA